MLVSDFSFSMLYHYSHLYELEQHLDRFLRSASMTQTVFVIYNINNNYIINNKSDKIKILKIRMTARHC
jgi:hypothetical protein